MTAFSIERRIDFLQIPADNFQVFVREKFCRVPNHANEVGVCYIITDYFFLSTCNLSSCSIENAHSNICPLALSLRVAFFHHNEFCYSIKNSAPQNCGALFDCKATAQNGSVCIPIFQKFRLLAQARLKVIKALRKLLRQVLSELRIVVLADVLHFLQPAFLVNRSDCRNLRLVDI